MPLSISLNKISFSYCKSYPVLSKLSLDLPSDKTILIKGENGIGKTTLASLAAGLLPPIKGSISYNYGSKQYIKIRTLYKHLSYLRQKTEHNLIGITPLEDLKIWLYSESDRVYDTDVRLINSLHDWNLKNKADTPVWELSAGEQKCLALAGIGLFKNRYWILDEPLSELDTEHTKCLFNMLQKKRTVSAGMLIISHQTEQLSGLADKVMVLTDKGLEEL